MIVMLVAGIGFLLAGLLAIGFGIPVKEFSFGNTLILTGAVAACTGMIMLGLWTVVRELKNIALRLGSGVARTSRADTRQRSAAASAALARSGPGKRRFPVQPRPAGCGQPRRCRTGSAAIRASPAPWQEEAASRDRARSDRRRCRRQPRPRQPSSRGAICCFPRHRGRNASAPRRERPIRPRPIFASRRLPRRRRSNQARPPPATFDDAWPQSERSRTADAPPQRRSGRAPSTFTEPSAGATGADRIRRPRGTRNSRRSRFSNRASSMAWPIRCIRTARSRRKCPKA